MKNKKILVVALLVMAITFSMIGCGKGGSKVIEGRYYCPAKDADSYVLDFHRDGTVDTYYSGQGTYSIDSKGVFKIDISVIHGTGTLNEDGSIDFNTTDGLSYQYVPESEREEEVVSLEDSFDATIMLDRMPFEYSKATTTVSSKQTDEDGSVYYQMTNDGSTITGTIGVDKNFLSTYGVPKTPEESIADVMQKGINGSNKYFEDDKFYLTLMLSGYTDTNCVVYHIYLIPKDENAADTNVYFAKLYFYDKELHTSLEEFTGIKNAINYVAGDDIFEYTFQDAMNSLSTLKAQM